MQNVGNRRSNELLEANFPANKSKPNENASSSVVEQFCRAKYEKKMWMARPDQVKQQQQQPKPQQQQPPPPQRQTPRREQPQPQRNLLEDEVDLPPPKLKPQVVYAPVRAPSQPKPQENNLLSFDNNVFPSNNLNSSSNVLEELVTGGFNNQPTHHKQTNQAPTQNILSLFDAPKQQPMQPQHMTYGQPFYGQQQPMHMQQQPMYPGNFQQPMPQYGAPQQGTPYSQFRF
jgi:hypothetical protein